MLVAGMLTAMKLLPKQSSAALQHLGLNPPTFSGHPWVRALSRTPMRRMSLRDEAQKRSAIPVCPVLTVRDGVAEGFLTHVGSAGSGSQLAGWWLCRVLGAPWLC